MGEATYSKVVVEIFSDKKKERLAMHDRMNHGHPTVS